MILVTHSYKIGEMIFVDKLVHNDKILTNWCITKSNEYRYLLMITLISDFARIDNNEEKQMNMVEVLQLIPSL